MSKTNNQERIAQLEQQVADLTQAMQNISQTVFSILSFLQQGQQQQPTRQQAIQEAIRTLDALDLKLKEEGYTLQFIDNPIKSTVVVLIKHNGKVVSRGKARCMKDECYNGHIGRAIALLRARGEEVPDILLNAPNPDSINRGNVVVKNSGDNQGMAGRVLGSKEDGTLVVLGFNGVVFESSIPELNILEDTMFSDLDEVLPKLDDLIPQPQEEAKEEIEVVEPDEIIVPKLVK